MDTLIVDPQTGNSFYQMTNTTWAGPSVLRTAVERGTHAFDNRPEVILRRIARLNRSERNAFVIGAQQAIRERLAKICDGWDASGVAGLSDHSRGQLDAILTAVGNAPAARTQIADRLFTNIRRENHIARTNNTAMGTSRTALRQAADVADQKGDGVLSSVMMDTLTGSPGIATGANIARNVLASKFRALGQRLTAAGDVQRSGEVLRRLGGQDQASVDAAGACSAPRSCGPTPCRHLPSSVARPQGGQQPAC
jgi:hypothetical protein